MALIEFSDVCFSYKGKAALNGLSLSIEKGSFVSILGSNGSGKTTLGKLLNAILVPTSGRVLVDGLDSADSRNAFGIRSRVALVMQNPDSQIIADTVEDDVAFGPENMGLSSSEIRRRVDESLELCGIGDLANLSPARLSGGQKQLVAIAGALAIRPMCIVLDEATSMLDPQSRDLVLSRIIDLNRSLGMTVVMMTHRPEEASLSDVLHLLEHGSLKTSGSPDSVFSNEKLDIGFPIAYDLRNRLEKMGIKLNSGIVDVDGIVHELGCRRKGC